jgi:hypothetical protein
MYLHSTFPADSFYTRSQLYQQWMTEAADCDRKGRTTQAETCRSIALTYKD